MEELSFLGSISAGFPSPAADWQARRLDVRDLLIPHPTTTYFARVSGYSMRGVCIGDGDIIVIDRAITATNNSIIVAVLGETFTIKRLLRTKKRTLLIAENAGYTPIDVTGRDDFEIWGVVTFVIHPQIALHPQRDKP
jgi:DNA polymerase V